MQNTNTTSILLFAIAVLRMKHSNDGYAYNHTLAHILVEYASAVSSCSKILLVPGSVCDA